MNSLIDTMQAIQHLIWNPEKKTIFGKNGASWCSIGLGTLVIAAIIVIFYHSIREVKKARRKQDSKSYPQPLQTSQSADTADSSTQQSACISNTINPHKQAGDTAELDFPMDDAGGATAEAVRPMVIKKRAISTEPNPPRSANPLRTDVLSPSFDGISSRQNYSGRQLTTKDINRFIIDPTKANPHLNVRFVHNSKFRAQRFYNNQVSTSGVQNERSKSTWQASTRNMSARKIKEHDPRTNYEPERIKFQSSKLSMQPRNVEQAQIIKRQDPRNYRQFLGIKLQAPSGYEPTHRFTQQAPRTNTKIPKIKVPKMETETTSNPDPPKEQPERRKK